MTQFALYPRILLVLAGFATVTPIFGGYLMGLLLLIWLATLWLLAKKRGAPVLSASSLRLDETFRAIARPVDIGVAIMVGAHLLSALLGWAFSDYGQSLYEVMRVATHMTIKWALLWFVLSGAMRVAISRGWQARDIGFGMAFAMTVTFFYSVAQRQTGIDWTHGFGAVLGPHRFAYGVYRVSGFMGHPLTLAYNLMLMILAAGALAGPLRQSLDASVRHAWTAVCLLATLTLLISGSRFVLLVLPAVIVLVEGRRLIPYLKYIVGLGLLLALVLWWEGSVVGRFLEFFDQRVPLTERFPRLVFWQVHWQMFVDHPLYGVTLAGLDHAMEVYYSAIGYRDNMYTAHNVFLQAMADSGLIGLAGVGALIAGIFGAARKARTLIGHATGLSYLPIATVLSGLMQNNLRDSEYLYALWFFLALLIIHASSLAARRSSSVHDERKPLKDFKPSAGRPDPT